MPLTRRQQQIYTYLVEHLQQFTTPPTLDALCDALGLSSRGSLHKHIQALVDEGLLEPMDRKQRGIRLRNDSATEEGIPYLGVIAAGQPIEALPQPEYLEVPKTLRSDRPCYVLKVRGDSMIEAGILDGDYVVIEQRETARNGEIVVALIDNENATLKRIEHQLERIILHPANRTMQPLSYTRDAVQIQGVLVGQMRRYTH